MTDNLIRILRTRVIPSFISAMHVWLNVTWTSKGNCLSKFMYAFVLWVWSPLYLLDFFFCVSPVPSGCIYCRLPSLCAHTNRFDCVQFNIILFHYYVHSLNLNVTTNYVHVVVGVCVCVVRWRRLTERNLARINSSINSKRKLSHKFDVVASLQSFWITKLPTEQKYIQQILLYFPGWFIISILFFSISLTLCVCDCVCVGVSYPSVCLSVFPCSWHFSSSSAHASGQ